MIRYTLYLIVLMPLCVFGQITSPVFNSDGSVTFSVYAPHAEEVYVKGSFAEKKFQIHTKAGTFGRSKKYEMVRNGDIWSYTTQPLTSEIYTYLFQIDDKDTIDIANPNKVRDVDTYYSYFIIPGTPGSLYIKQNVPHGEVDKVWYPSTLNNMKQRRMTVYLPAEYKENPTKHYPVLYLLHGSGGDENSWTEAGAAAEIMDNMIAQGNAKPMIVVMPNGNVSLDAAPGESLYMKAKPSAMNVSSMLGKVEKVFVNDIVKYVDSNYRTISQKDYRAIAGLSLGGLQTIYITANNPDFFSYVGLFSAQARNFIGGKNINRFRNITNSISNIKSLFTGVINNTADVASDVDIYENIDDKLKVQFSKNPKLYYIAVGKDDFVKKLNDDFRTKLDTLGCKYTYNETTGSHSWENWRRYLLDLLPKLFQ